MDSLELWVCLSKEECISAILFLTCKVVVPFVGKLLTGLRAHMYCVRCIRHRRITLPSLTFPSHAFTSDIITIPNLNTV